MTELKPCPFCGSKVMRIHDDKWDKIAIVYCASCQADGPICRDKEEAIARWNKRALTEAKEEPLAITGKIYFVDGHVYIEPDEEGEDG